MSTPVTPAVPAPIHPAWYARAGTWLLKVGTAVKNGILKVAGAEPKIAAAIAEIAPTAEAISNLVVPGSGSFEAHLLDVWGVAASAVKGAGDAAAANGISVTLDAALVAEIKAILPAVEAFLHPTASSAPPTA
jgi:hypothetical protein